MTHFGAKIIDIGVFRDTAITEKNAAVAERDAAVKAKATAEAETQKYKQLYSQAQNATSDLISQLSHQKAKPSVGRAIITDYTASTFN